MNNKLIESVNDLLSSDPTRPVIFLDIDEVLNSQLNRSPSNLWYQLNTEVRYFRGNRVDRSKFDKFCSICKLTNAIVIIVSSWMPSHRSCDDKETKEIRIFFDGVDIQGSLNTTGGFERGRSVDRFLDVVSPARYAVIDDALGLPDKMYDTEFREKHKEHLVAVNGFYGALDSDFYKLFTLCNVD